MPVRNEEPPLRPDELRVLRRMIEERAQEQAVGIWFNQKWRAVAWLAGFGSACAVLTASVIEIAKALHG